MLLCCIFKEVSCTLLVLQSALQHCPGGTRKDSQVNSHNPGHWSICGAQFYSHKLQEHLSFIAELILHVVQCCKDRHAQEQNTAHAAAGTPPLPPTVLTTRVPSLSATLTT